MSSVFTDNAVLQRGGLVPIWGNDTPGTVVTVSFAGQSKSAAADAVGNWVIRLDVMEASAQPRDLTVKGSTSVTLRRVLVGEVWICAGQSNMEFELSRAQNGPADVAAAARPGLRIFHVERQATDSPVAGVVGQWDDCTPRSVRNFSAVAYYFGRDLQTSLSVPVGLIEIAWGGTTAYAWTSADALKTNPNGKRTLDDYFARPPATPQQVIEIRRARAELSQARKDAIARGVTPPTTEPTEQRLIGDWGPTRLFNGMIAPVSPFAIRGVIYYQGESDSHNWPADDTYRDALTRLIGDWRNVWGQGDFPFLIVQLPNNGARQPNAVHTAWARTRESQALVAVTVPNAAYAVTIDTSGDGNLHPTEKQPVGQRLARLAEGFVYAQKVVYHGPTFASFTTDGPRAVVSFHDTASGLKAAGNKNGDGPIGFFIAGADRKFVPAKAVIDGKTVTLTNDQVAAPVAVRYGWGANPECTLYNTADLPAAPFRTDDWAK